MLSLFEEESEKGEKEMEKNIAQYTIQFSFVCMCCFIMIFVNICTPGVAIVQAK